MKAEVKSLWLEALRSGNYQQGKGFLRTDDNEFCCLGVLTDLYKKEHNQIWSDQDWDLATLTGEVSEWAGINDSGRFDCEVDGYEDLTEMNDTARVILNSGELLSLREYDFNAIADVIEKHF